MGCMQWSHVLVRVLFGLSGVEKHGRGHDGGGDVGRAGARTGVHVVVENGGHGVACLALGGLGFADDVGGDGDITDGSREAYLAVACDVSCKWATTLEAPFIVAEKLAFAFGESWESFERSSICTGSRGRARRRYFVGPVNVREPKIFHHLNHFIVLTSFGVNAIFVLLRDTFSPEDNAFNAGKVFFAA